VTAGQSRGMTDGEEMPTAASHGWNTACAMRHNVADLLFSSALLRRVKTFHECFEDLG
jgi:hypothetical protein